MTDPADPREVELKLRIPPEILPRLLQHRLLQRSTGAPPRKRLVSTYFDTPDFRLMHAQLALRVRKIGRRHIQTLKCPPSVEHGVNSRGEWEREVQTDRPVLKGATLRAVGDRKLRKLLSTDKVKQKLTPQFVTDFRRATWPLKVRDSEIEFAIDVGEIKSSKGSLSVCEVELELKSGGIGGVYALAQELHKSIPFTIEPLSKAERGFALVADTPPRPRRAAPLELPRGCSIGDAFARIGRACLLHLRANEAALRANRSSDGVYQVRVGLRRLRSALSAFRELLPAGERRRLGGDMRWIAKQFGRAREWDVFHRDILTRLRKQMPQDRSLEDLAAIARAARNAAYREVVETAASARYTESLLRLEAWWESGSWSRALGQQRDEAARDFARRALRRLHRRIVKLGDNLDGLDEAGRHDMRIRAKKLRYTAEFFHSLFRAKPARAYLAALAEIQDRLGSLQDGAMVKGLLAELERREKTMQPAQVARAAGLIAGWNGARVAADLERLPKAWVDFAAVKPFWK